MLKFCSTIFTQTFVGYTELIILFNFCQQIFHHFKNQELTNFYFVLQSFILCGFCQKAVRLNTMIFYLISIISTTLFVIAQSKLNILSLLNRNKSLEKIEKYSKGFEQYSYVCRCSDLRHPCTFGLANRLSGRFSSATELELNLFRPFPFGELVQHLSTQVNNGLLSASITVFYLRRNNRMCFIPFLVYAMVYPIISSNLVTLATLSPGSDSVYMHTCSPFSRKPLLR